jgi:hypothetical protein
VGVVEGILVDSILRAEARSMVVLEDNIHWEVPDLSTRCYCSRPVAEETGRMVPEKGIGRRRDRRLDGPEEDTLVVDPVAIVSISLYRTKQMR